MSTLGVRDHLPPIQRPLDGAQRFGQLSGIRVQAGHDLHAQSESELESDLLRVLGQDGHRTGADIAKADDSYVHIIHKSL